METCSVVLTFESVDEILWYDHSGKTSLAVLLHGTIYFSVFIKLNNRPFYSVLSFSGSKAAVDLVMIQTLELFRC